MSVEEGQMLVAEIDRLANEVGRIQRELLEIRQRLDQTTAKSKRRAVSSRKWAEFGMWADREDLRGLTSAEWLAELRAKGWTRTRNG